MTDTYPICKLCYRLFRIQKHLTEHMSKKHNNVRDVKTKFESPRKLRYHSRNCNNKLNFLTEYISKKKTPQCSWCETKFESVEELRSHSKICTKELIFQNYTDRLNLVRVRKIEKIIYEPLKGKKNYKVVKTMYND